MTREEQILDCQTPKGSYIGGIADAEKRLKKGQRRTYCVTCERWRWADEQCELYDRDSVLEAELIREYRRK